MSMQFSEILLLRMSLTKFFWWHRKSYLIWFNYSTDNYNAKGTYTREELALTIYKIIKFIENK